MPASVLVKGLDSESFPLSSPWGWLGKLWFTCLSNELIEPTFHFKDEPRVVVMRAVHTWSTYYLPGIFWKRCTRTIAGEVDAAGLFFLVRKP